MKLPYAGEDDVSGLDANRTKVWYDLYGELIEGKRGNGFGSGLLTTFGGSQEVFAGGCTAAGCIAPCNRRGEPPEAARNQAV